MKGGIVSKASFVLYATVSPRCAVESDIEVGEGALESAHGLHDDAVLVLSIHGHTAREARRKCCVEMLGKVAHDAARAESKPASGKGCKEC